MDCFYLLFLLEHMRHSDLGVLFKNTGHKAIAANIIDALWEQPKNRKKNYLYLTFYIFTSYLPYYIKKKRKSVIEKKKTMPQYWNIKRVKTEHYKIVHFNMKLVRQKTGVMCNRIQTCCHYTNLLLTSFSIEIYQGFTE